MSDAAPVAIFGEDSSLPAPAAESVTPLMKQYYAIKAQNPGAILLYRMGDFFELFDDDAKVGAQVLGLTLTKRNHGMEQETPLAGFPCHALERYATRLVRAGYRIAICEQVEDPKKARGVVKRDVVEVVSAGTATDERFIDEKSNNYIMGCVWEEAKSGAAVCDLSTGEFWTVEMGPEEMAEEMARIEPSEILVREVDAPQLERALGRIGHKAVVTAYDAWKFETETAQPALLGHFGVLSLQGLGLEPYPCAVRAAGALLQYLKEQKKNDLRHIAAITPRALGRYAELDPASIRNLELLRPLNPDDAGGALLSVLDKTATAMGARLLRQWITHPLLSISEINARLDCVDWLRRDMFARGELGLLLRSVADIERLASRMVFERANGRDLVALKNSLEVFPRIMRAAGESAPPMAADAIAALGGFEADAEEIGRTIVDHPPLSVREGGMVRPGVSAQLDELRDASVNGKKWIAALQESERRRTGIASLKVGYNKVFGYYIEISKANLGAAPPEYIRKQTLVNGERFVTPELKEMEEKILHAEERLSTLEFEVFAALRKKIAGRCVALQKAAEAIAQLDVFTSLAAVAAERNYCRPVLTEGTDMAIKDGRHPVIEQMLAGEQFVPNDTNIKGDETRILLITGPNMAGKSTYLRQNAHIAIMAQIGSFVPAASANIGIVDKFYTRVGASDRLARGQSTFLVEMIEVANILNNATDRSLVLLDEVGRGTSTFDGISIAWAVAEHLHECPGRNPRTFFATHYHELTELAILFPRIKNLHVKVKEWNDTIIFLRKIEDGSCDHSYGIQVARLAGVPRQVIVRAKEILANLERAELTPDGKPALARRAGRVKSPRPAVPNLQTDLFAPDSARSAEIERANRLMNEIADLDVNNMTPMQALQTLAALHAKARQY